MFNRQEQLLFNRTDLDLVAGDTIWIVDWVDGDHQVVDLAAVNVGSAAPTLMFSEDAIHGLALSLYLSSTLTQGASAPQLTKNY